MIAPEGTLGSSHSVTALSQSVRRKRTSNLTAPNHTYGYGSNGDLTTRAKNRDVEGISPVFFGIFFVLPQPETGRHEVCQ